MKQNTEPAARNQEFIFLVNINGLIKQYKANEFCDFTELDKYKFIGLVYPYMSLFVDNIKKINDDDVLLMLAYDTKMRLQYKYNDIHIAKSNKRKMKNMCGLLLKYNQLVDKLEEDIVPHGKLSVTNIYAAMLKIELITGIRIGKDYHFNKTNSVGLSTLQNKHVTIKDKNLFLKFIGKKQVSYVYNIQDDKILSIIQMIHDKSKPDQFIFRFNGRKITYVDINDYIKYILNDTEISNKDLRTMLANVTFIGHVMKLYKESNKKNIEKIISLAVTHVAEVLQNTKAVSKKSYVFVLISEFLMSNDLDQYIQYDPIQLLKIILSKQPKDVDK